MKCLFLIYNSVIGFDQTQSLMLNFTSFKSPYDNESIIYNNRLIDPVGRVFANDPGDLGSISGRVIPKT